MHFPIPDRHTGLTMLVLWTIVMLIAVATYFGIRHWRHRHKGRASHTQSYSQRLGTRLSPGKSRKEGNRGRKPKR